MISDKSETLLQSKWQAIVQEKADAAQQMLKILNAMMPSGSNATMMNPEQLRSVSIASNELRNTPRHWTGENMWHSLDDLGELGFCARWMHPWRCWMGDDGLHLLEQVFVCARWRHPLRRWPDEDSLYLHEHLDMLLLRAWWTPMIAQIKMPAINARKAQYTNNSSSLKMSFFSGDPRSTDCRGGEYPKKTPTQQCNQAP